jgi:hypothetical protein
MVDEELNSKILVNLPVTNACVLRMPRLLDRPMAFQVDGRAKHLTKEEQVTTCALPVGSRHGHVKGPFLSCSAALVATAGVRCTACIGARAKAVSD